MMRPWLLAGGMLTGAALAVVYIARAPESAPMTVDVVAWVNGRPIARESYESALRAVASDRKTGVLDSGDRERVLERLIDQELLIDRAIELGLHERDPQLRNQLATAMIDFLVRRAEDDTTEATDAELEAYYEAERFRFARAAQIRIAVDGNAVPLPDGFLLEREVSQRLGPTMAARVSEMRVGEVIESDDGAYRVTLLERRGGDVVPFDEAREAVRAAYQRHRSEEAVREFLSRARTQSDIVVELD